MAPTARRQRTRLAFLLWLIVCTGAGSCTLRLISEYDQQTDEAVTAVHRTVERLLADIERTAGTEAGAHANFVERYSDARVMLRTLALRAESRPRNELQQQQLANVIRQLDLMEAAHREGLARAEVEPFRRGFDTSFRSILTLELAKKRGAGR